MLLNPPIPIVIPQVEPISKELNFLNSLECVGDWDFTRDKGGKVFNLMNKNKDFINLVSNPTMSIDSNSDGIADGFTHIPGAGITSTPSIEDYAQKITITQTTLYNLSIIQSELIPALPGQILSASVLHKPTHIVGSIRMGFRISFYDSNRVFLSSNPTSGTNILSDSSYNYRALTNIVCPESTAFVSVDSTYLPNTIGSIGAVSVKDLVLVKSPTFTSALTNGTVVGPVQKALGKYFDGIDDYISIGNNGSLNTNNAFTLSVILKPSNSGNSWIMCKNNDDAVASVQYGLYCSSSSSKYKVFLNGSERLASNTAIDITKFCILTVTWNGTTIKLYINGKLDQSAAYSGELFSMPNLYFGCRGNTGGTRAVFFNGIIGKVQIYKRELSSVQVLQVTKIFAPKYSIAA